MLADGGLRVEKGAVAIHVDDARRVRGRGGHRARIRNQRGDPGVLCHKLEPLGRIAGVHRHVGRPCLENAKQRDDQLGRALHAHAHQAFHSNAQAAQVVRQLVRAAVKLAVRQPPVLEDDCDGVRRAVHLRFDQVVDAPVQVDGGGGGVPGPEELLALGRRQQRQQADGTVRLRHDGSAQVQEVPDEPLDRRRIEQACVVFDRPLDAIGSLAHVERDIELGCDAGEAHGAEREAGKPPGLLGRVLENEHHLEERRVAECAFGLHGLDDLLKRHILVLVRGQRGLANATRGIRGTAAAERAGRG